MLLNSGNLDTIVDRLFATGDQVEASNAATFHLLTSTEVKETFRVRNGDLILDASCSPYSKTFQITRRSNSTGSLIIDFGLLSNPRAIRVNTTVKFVKYEIGEFSISGDYTAYTASLPPRDRRLLVIGQSLGLQWASEGNAQAFIEERAQLGDLNSWSFVNLSAGNSAALQEYCNPDRPSNWWYNLDTGVHGPVLTSALSRIETMPSHEAITDILWVQGQREGEGYIPGSIDKAVFMDRYANAVYDIVNFIRRKISPTNHLKIPAFIQLVGTRKHGDYEGDTLVRFAQRQLAREYGNENFHLGAVQPFNLPLRDSVHPSKKGAEYMGKLTALAIP